MLIYEIKRTTGAPVFCTATAATEMAKRFMCKDESPYGLQEITGITEVKEHCSALEDDDLHWELEKHFRGLEGDPISNITLYLIRGLPGSGKSTKAKEMLKERRVSRVIEADDFFVDDKGNYKFDASRLGEAHAQCRDRCRKALCQGRSVAVANTFIRRWETEAYYDMAKELGIKVEVIRCGGNYGSVHNVPEEALTRMKENWEEF